MPVIAFTSQPGTVTEPVFAGISTKHGIDFLRGITDSLRAAQARGLVVTTDDQAHWNETGHRIVAGLLVAALRDRQRTR